MKSILLICFFFVGCTPYTKIVEVPITAKYSIAELPYNTYLPIYSINEKNSPDEVLKAYVASVRVLKLSEDACRINLEGIRNAN